MYDAFEIIVGILSLALFPTKLLVGELIFSRHMRRRERFGIRLAVSALAQGVIATLLYLPLRQTGLWFLENTLFYTLEFALSAAFLLALFDEKLSDLVPVAVAGYLTEHVSTQIFEIFFGSMKAGLESGGYLRLSLFLVLQLGLFAVTAAVIWLLFARKAGASEGVETLKKSLLRLSVVTLGVILFLSSVRDEFAYESRALMVITRLFSIFSSFTLLYIRYVLLEKSRLEAERSELTRVIELERRQFERGRENIELINIKCHDMRHKIEAWERRGLAVDKAEIAEMKELIGIYDSAVKTGNETLDVILTERSLYCEKEGIRLSCIADGEKLGFMSTGDICALFGNAIENAIEAVSKLEDPEDRIISFQVRENRGMLIITVDNYYAGGLSLENGLPVSTKGDSLNHGFGVRSIRLVAEKYGGELSVSVDEMFHLNVIIPIPQI